LRRRRGSASQAGWTERDAGPRLPRW
jgi:hypothetical protein